MPGYFFKNCILLLVFLCFNCGCAVQIYSDKDSAINFSQYKTYAWLENTDSVKNYFYDNSQLEQDAKNYVNYELKRRGYIIDRYNPDLLLEYHSSTHGKYYKVKNPVFNYSTYPYSPTYDLNSASNGYNQRRLRAYKYFELRQETLKMEYWEGLLMVYIIDRNKSQVIWRGWSVGGVRGEYVLEGSLQWDIFRIFRKYPVPQVRNKIYFRPASK